MTALLATFLLGLTLADPTDQHVLIISIDGLPASYLDDPKASLPTIRGLAAVGVAATDGMRVSNPSVTWPNHTTLMTGVQPRHHGVLFNGRLERGETGQPVRVVPASTQAELVRVPMLFDVLAEAGIESAAINWPCTRGSNAIADNFPDVPDALKHSTPRLVSELDQAGWLGHFNGGSGVVRDEVWTEAACLVIERRRPRLMALHLLNLDSTHHQYGPQSSAGYSAAALADARVGRVLESLDRAGLRGQTAVFIVSDHGFAAVPKSLRPNGLLRDTGLLTVDGGRIKTARAMVVPEGGIGMLYLLDPQTADQDRESVRTLFEGQEGVAAVLGPDQFERLGLPDPSDHEGMADLILVAKDGYSVSGATDGSEFVVTSNGTPGAHGFLTDEPKMRAMFVASGEGIASGATLDTVDNADVAPTIAKLLGVELEQATGRPLESILVAPARN